MHKKRNYLIAGVCALVLFALWTALLTILDVSPIGPQGSSVGFSTFNRFVHDLTGVHPVLYELTDLLSLIPLGFVAGFALRGLSQWIKRKHLARIDRSILLLGGFYVVVLMVFVAFEAFTINYRPVLIQGVLESAYPSSTTMLVLCVMPTALWQLRSRGCKSKLLAAAIYGFTLFMVAGRVLSGVHWASDIIGAILLSTGLLCLYRSAQ